MAYLEKYPVGTVVKIGSLERLRAFQGEWKFHHPIQDKQFAFAGAIDKVKGVGFYHLAMSSMNWRQHPEVGTNASWIQAQHFKYLGIPTLEMHETPCPDGCS